MSIYSLIAFNSAVNQMKKNDQDAQSIQQAKIKTQAAQEELDISKKMDIAKAKDARNQGMISDYVGNALEKHINEQYKPKQDMLDAAGDGADLKLHQAQQQSGQLAAIVQHLHQNDPDVQAHVASMTGQGPADVNPITGGESQQAQQSVAPVPSIVPQMQPQPQQQPTVATPPQQPVDYGSQLLGAPEPQSNANNSNSAPSQAQPEQEGGVDLSPMEQALGMPKGSLWLNPSTAKPEISPVWKSRIESQQRAQANYDVNQPFREEQREDKNIKTAESYLVNSLKQRGGAIGLQNNKVDAAIHARALINQSYDESTGKYNITQVPYAELSESMGALLSGQSGSSEGRIAALKQNTLYAQFQNMASFLKSQPTNANSQKVIKQLVDMIDRQGEVSEDLRDKAFDKLKGLSTFKRLNDEDFQNLKDQLLGNSFKEELAKAPDKQSNAQSFKNEQDAEKANLPKGSIVIINGRRAKVN